jgi:sirohydrochlorin cobaltochelatase
VPHSFANDVLLLIGHGSGRYLDAGSAMHRHARQLRAEHQFAQVEVALLNGFPSVPEALNRIEAPTIRVVPFFMEDGYFSRVAVPRVLRGRLVLLCPSVGVHDGMAGLIERHALTVCDRLGIPSRTAAVLVVGHGSSSAPGRALALHRHTARVAATELFARVETACLEEAPFVAEALRGLRTHPTVMIGCFANQGGHVRDDMPALIAAEQAARRHTNPGVDGFAVRFDGSIADDPAMIQIIMDQAREGMRDHSAGE